MTPMQIKIAVYGGAALIAWWLTARAMKRSKGDVELGVGTVDGAYGGDYQTLPNKTAAKVDTANPAIDPAMREVIDRSNRILAADDVAGDNQ